MSAPKKKPESFSSAPENKTGVGLRIPHVDHILKNLKKISEKIGWFEVHSENYYHFSSQSFADLKRIRQDFPISLHSVGNALGSAQKPDLNHLKKLKDLVKKIEPFLVSDHISWGMVGKRHLNDLLPLPYNKESLQVIADNVSIMQDYLGRQILVENPSAYLAFKNPEMSEGQFINSLVKKTGCALLLDVNNVFVSASNNQQFDASNYLDELDKNIVAEIHLAGHSQSSIGSEKKRQTILIDTHNDKVCGEVWKIYQAAVKKFGKIPSLIEWDQDFPPFSTLLHEAKKAQNIMSKYAQ